MDCDFVGGRMRLFFFFLIERKGSGHPTGPKCIKKRLGRNGKRNNRSRKENRERALTQTKPNRATDSEEVPDPDRTTGLLPAALPASCNPAPCSHDRPCPASPNLQPPTPGARSCSGHRCAPHARSRAPVCFPAETKLHS
jgi:hypothetical protein